MKCSPLTDRPIASRRIAVKTTERDTIMEFQSIPLENLTIPDQRPHHGATEADSLAASIRAQGVLQ